MSRSKQKKHQNPSQASDPQSSNTELPNSYSISDGFLVKDDARVALVTSGIFETAAQGFLHVDEPEKYKTV